MHDLMRLPWATGWFGTAVLSDATLDAGQYLRYGYPYLVPCPDGTTGTLADCPGGTVRTISMNTTYPFLGAQIWGQTAAAGSMNIPPSWQGVLLINGFDVTVGDSGSAIWDNDSKRVVGIVSNHRDKTNNLAARWTNTTASFVDANSRFPSDN